MIKKRNKYDRKKNKRNKNEKFEVKNKIKECL